MGTQIKLVDSNGRIKGQVKDSKGMLTSSSDINGQVGFGYDDNDRLISLKVTTETSSTFGYDDNGARTAYKQPNDVNTGYVYDDAGKLSSLETSTSAGVKLLDQIYEYIDDFNIATETISGQSQTYNYDDADQLIKWTNASGVETTYTYDASGNMTKAGPRTMAYDTTTTNELSAMVYGSDLYSFDYERGNLTSISNGTDTTTYTWTGGNRLTSISSPDTSAAFTYDAEGKRLTKTINGATTQFVYDDIKLIAEKDASGAVTAQYIYDDSGQLISMKKGGDTYYFHLNHRGDVMKITDASEAVVATYSYDPWGNILSSTGSFADEQPFRYASYYWDSEIGMYYLINRYYDPSVGRFISKDPAGDSEASDLAPAEVNPYAYSDNNPVMGSDPDGLYWDGNPSYHRLLYYGSQGEDVRQLQIALRRVDQIFEIWINQHGGADGIFGSATSLVVETYQKGFGLAVDRIVGPQTWGSLVAKGFLRGCPAFAPSQSPAPYTASQPGTQPRDVTSEFLGKMRANAKVAREKAIAPWNIGATKISKLAWFALQVAPGKRWDYKVHGYPASERFGFGDIIVNGDDLGNINYGYVGTSMRIGKSFLHSAGGAVQLLVSKSKAFKWWATRFDEPKDVGFVSLGVNMYKQARGTSEYYFNEADALRALKYPLSL